MFIDFATIVTVIGWGVVVFGIVLFWRWLASHGVVLLPGFVVFKGPCAPQTLAASSAIPPLARRLVGPSREQGRRASGLRP
jgi:hypothetical protein